MALWAATQADTAIHTLAASQLAVELRNMVFDIQLPDACGTWYTCVLPQAQPLGATRMMALIFSALTAATVVHASVQNMRNAATHMLSVLTREDLLIASFLNTDVATRGRWGATLLAWSASEVWVYAPCANKGGAPCKHYLVTLAHRTQHSGALHSEPSLRASVADVSDTVQHGHMRELRGSMPHF